MIYPTLNAKSVFSTIDGCDTYAGRKHNDVSMMIGKQFMMTSSNENISAWTNVWANNLDVADLRRHRGHYDPTVMFCPTGRWWFSTKRAVMRSFGYVFIADLNMILNE